MHHYSAAATRPANQAFIAAWKKADGAASTPNFVAVGGWDGMGAIMHAVRGMLQHNTLGAEQLTHFRVYAGAEHKHEAQRPQPITFGELGEIIVARNS